MADRSPDLTRLLASTHESFSKEVAIQVTEGSRFLTVMKQRGAFYKTEGEHHSFSIRKGENQNVQNYDKDTTANRNAQTLSSRLHDYPKFIRVTETIPDTEIDLNKGSATKIFDLYTEKAEWASEDLSEQINTQLYTDNSSDNKKFNGLETLIDTSNTYLGLNRSTELYWRSNELDVANDFSANGRGKMQRLGQDITHTASNKYPSVIFTTKATYNNYVSTIFDKYSIESETLKDLAFPTASFDGAPLIWDTDCPADRMYFLRVGEGKKSPYKILVWFKNFVAPTVMERYTEGITFGYKCIMQPESCEPRSIGKLINTDTN